MPPKLSTSERIIEICNKKGVSIFLDGTDEDDAAKIGSYYTYEPKDKILKVYLQNLRPSTWNTLRPFFEKKWKELQIVVDIDDEESIETYLEYQEDNPNSEIIDFFEGNIPSRDLLVLKMALYLREEKEKGNKIDEYKNEIWDEYG